MLKSMTGFGRSQIDRDDYSLKVEMKTVNSRYLDIHFRMPKVFNAYEDAMRKTISEYLTRGKLDVFVEFQLRPGAGLTIEPNLDVIAKYAEAYRAIAESQGITTGVPLNLLTTIPDGLIVSESELDEERLGQDIEQVLSAALTQLDSMRTTEGENLRQDLLTRSLAIREAVARIEQRHPEILVSYKEQMQRRIEELLLQPNIIDNERLEIELAIYAEKKDIQEELTRIHSHLGQFEELLTQGQEVGRTLDFLSQELNREINTIGSKSSGYEISREVIELKSQLDKIREQIQNVE